MSEEAKTREPRVAVVGGSISGLSVAILLGQLGYDLAVLERHAAGAAPRSAGLGVDLDLLAAITGEPERRPPILRLQERRVFGHGRGERVDIPVTGYDLLRAFLRAQVTPARLRAPTEVVGVDLDAGGPTRLRLRDGPVRDFDVVIGADGWRSAVRDAVLGVGGPSPEYAGYVLWRGFVDEAALGPELQAAFFDAPALWVAPHARQHFVAYPVPGAGGEVEAGARRLAWGLYCGAAEHRLGGELAVDRDQGRPGYGVDASACGGGLLDDLLAAAAITGSSSLVALVERSLAVDAVVLHPVHELVAPRLVRGGAVLVGDAAHLASPITGNGARTAMYDALVLVRSLVDFNEVESALGIYETRRLPIAKALVEQGRAVGWGFRLG